MGPSINEALQLAEQKFVKRDFLGAKIILEEIVSSDPTCSRANELLAYILWNEGNTQRGLEYLKKAVSASDCSPIALYEIAVIYTNQGNYSEAIPLFEKSLERSGGFFELYHEYGRALASNGNYQKSLAIFLKAEAIHPGSVEVLFNLGRLNELLENAENALHYYEKVLSIDASYGPALNNRAGILNDRKQYQEALASYERALSLEPNNPELLTNKGAALSNLGRHAEAVEVFTKALNISPTYFDALELATYALCTLKRYKQALSYAEKALQINPLKPYLFGFAAHLRSLICDWKSFDEDALVINKKIDDGEKVVLPFQALCMFDDPALQYQCAKIFAQGEHSTHVVRKQSPSQLATKKIRIGYFSADFGYHPVSFLIAEVFELHDRERFEVVGFSVGPNTGDPMRKRLEKSFDEFHDVVYLQDREIAKLAKDKNIDIAIDLTGYTQDSRTNIFSYRAAPVQVNYLGYPGTLGAPYIDYIIADPILIPESEQQFYTEKIAYLPHSYQPNDRLRKIADDEITRSMHGFAEDDFVFCCFNNNFKITPKVFGLWMKILQRVDQSVLWLLEDNADASNNLRKAAIAYGISERRLVFAPRAPMDKHIARMRLANLFLDTLPYNAHTTASDALWAGLPVLTCKGRSFASRVAASLLHAVNLPELIVESSEAYVETAISLARDTKRLLAMRAKLENSRHQPLFDTPAYVSELEKALLKMHAQYLAAEPATTFYID
jgi:predicted O-linked N-acetylglucosamine transferase (SPINDLY family)